LGICQIHELVLCRKIIDSGFKKPKGYIIHTILVRFSVVSSGKYWPCLRQNKEVQLYVIGVIYSNAPFNEINSTYFFLQASIRLEGITFDDKVSRRIKQ
jgi:hypothetical protein